MSLATFSEGVYISDVHIGEGQSLRVKAFRLVLAPSCADPCTFTSAMRPRSCRLCEAGFASAQIHQAHELHRASTCSAAGSGLGRPPRPYAGGVRRRDLDDSVHRSRLPMGLFGDPGAARARVALRRPAFAWRLVLVGLTEQASQYEARGYTPLRGALGQPASVTATGCPSRPPRRPASAPPRAPVA